VRQEDLFFSQLTVRETLSLAAELQLPDTMAPETKDRYISDLLFRLGLVSAAQLQCCLMLEVLKQTLQYTN
jgi:ABC-type multidrug transport system ATPase subunit